MRTIVANSPSRVRAINARHEKQVVVVAVVGRAVIAPREKVRRGEIPLVENQAALFTDECNHPGPVVGALAAYTTHAVIYGETPVGLSTLQSISDWGKGTPAEREAQEVFKHPLAGITPLKASPLQWH